MQQRAGRGRGERRRWRAGQSQRYRYVRRPGADARAQRANGRDVRSGRCIGGRCRAVCWPTPTLDDAMHTGLITGPVAGATPDHNNVTS